ncbi:nucleotidyltransferase domain-containing protein [Thiospirochaeta perfilievii]|uniref:Nucleotidyltransferase domain-containing protein n=1 Tax=Thiospirochaeta perfilievii TaxID=252967 RepID=A0A5C1QGC2_9SPIO|nr:nucleotidyltransferase domain-containing protein [Thiospirochaeta perfilievii]QEN05654.1 nucleotidyltransferase domain-containing protein [Thiospirochaeta perfilievii]
MRLSPRLQKLFVSTSRNLFGESNIYLFGSRTDDSKKGGDFDIAIEYPESADEFKKLKIKFITSIIQQGYDIKIDLVQLDSSNSLINSEIRETGILL